MILLDTTPLVALCDPRDPLHSRALADLDRIRRRELTLCEAVLTEACFLLSNKIQRERLSRLLNALAIRPLVFDDASVWPRVFDWLQRYAEHQPDWADGLLVIACSIHSRARIWTYDREFQTTWRREDGSRVTLAVKIDK